MSELSLRSLNETYRTMTLNDLLFPPRARSFTRARVACLRWTVLLKALVCGLLLASSTVQGQAPPKKDGADDPPKSERQVAQERKAREAARKRGEITFDDLKFDIEKGGTFKEEMITESIEELNKKVVKLRGFILPTSVFQQSGIKQFVLVRDNQECCFGPGAALYDCVIIEMAEGKTTNFSTRVVSVKGKLEVDPESFQYPDGGHYAIYKMTADEVR